MKARLQAIPKIGTLKYSIVVLFLAVALVGVAFAGDGPHTIRWDLVHVTPDGVVSAGGIASAKTVLGSIITLTGSGTFVDPGDPEAVSGGGTWETRDPDGNVTGSGSYVVQRLLKFDEAPGLFPGTEDQIGDPENFRSGLAYLRIAYDDGQEGTLTVSCHGAGTPDDVFEGITASKNFIGYYNAVLPVPGVDENRSSYHIVP